MDFPTLWRHATSRVVPRAHSEVSLSDTDAATQQLATLAAGKETAIATAFTRYTAGRPLDTSGLPAELVEKHRCRHAIGRTTLDNGLLYRLWIGLPSGLLMLIAAVGMLIGLIVMCIGVLTGVDELHQLVMGEPVDTNGTTLVIGAAMIGGALLSAAIGSAIVSVGERWAPHPLVLTPAECSQLRDAQVRWPSNSGSSELTGLPAEDRLRAELRDTSPTRAWPETRTIGLALVLAQEIRTSPAWRSDVLDTARIDLEQVLDDVQMRAWRIWKVRATVITSDSDRVAAALRESTRTASQAADAAWIALVKLVTMLHRYRADLLPIEDMLAELAALERTANIDIDDAIRQLHIDAAGSELDQDIMAAHITELADIRTALTARVAALRAALNVGPFTLPLATAAADIAHAAQ
ncbi:hypothetical protein [Nocardia altamirensis]|uniref:hypothetical protein n=1 Tax=Nocardia altamirensis TaxID=472158 RepID=UPI00084038EF|nr:hypothetical protein [Nocardia altamirensis]